jgi:hypothetical protein
VTVGPAASRLRLRDTRSCGDAKRSLRPPGASRPSSPRAHSHGMTVAAAENARPLRPSGSRPCIRITFHYSNWRAKLGSLGDKPGYCRAITRFIVGAPGYQDDGLPGAPRADTRPRRPRAPRPARVRPALSFLPPTLTFFFRSADGHRPKGHCCYAAGLRPPCPVLRRASPRYAHVRTARARAPKPRQRLRESPPPGSAVEGSDTQRADRGALTAPPKARARTHSHGH